MACWLILPRSWKTLGFGGVCAGSVLDVQARHDGSQAFARLHERVCFTAPCHRPGPFRLAATQQACGSWPAAAHSAPGLLPVSRLAQRALQLLFAGNTSSLYWCAILCCLSICLQASCALRLRPQASWHGFRRSCASAAASASRHGPRCRVPHARFSLLTALLICADTASELCLWGWLSRLSASLQV